jgi:hypothetical protein
MTPQISHSMLLADCLVAQSSHQTSIPRVHGD